jgi:small subunit ribosomal protein S6
MRIYEELFILRPDAPEEEIDHLIEQLTTFIASQGGNVDKSDKWGIRKLAYRVQKRTEGFYVLLQFTTKPETVIELERRLRVSDLVMKFQSVRIDEKLKKIAKRKKEREKRAARKPAPVAPSVPLEHAMAGAAEPAGPRPGAPMPGAPVAPAAAGATAPVAAAPVAEKVGE